MIQLKNNKLIQSALSDLKKLSKVEIAKKKLSFKFESEFLNYQPFLKEFSSQHYKIFNEISYQLDLQGSIVDLFGGEVVNKTENRPAYITNTALIKNRKSLISRKLLNPS